MHVIKLLCSHPQLVTSTARGGMCDSIAINGNTIEAVGKYEALQNLILPGTEMMDAKGRTIMPGFNDSHIHLESG